MKRILMMLALSAFLVAAISVSALSAFAAPQPCTAGEPGCTSKKLADQETSPSQGNPPENAEEPFTLETTKSGKGKGAQPLSNPHTEVTTTCWNNAHTHEFSDPSKCA